MSYSFNIKGKFKIEAELVRDVIRMLDEIEIEYERPKKSIFEIEDEGSLEEAELNELIDVFEHIFDYIVSDLDQSVFIYIHELDPVEREINITTNHVDLISQSDSISNIIFLDKGLYKNTRNVTQKIAELKQEIILKLNEINILSKWQELSEETNPYILPAICKIKIKGGNKGLFLSTLLDDDLDCENYEEIFQIKNENLKNKFTTGYIGVRISLRAFYTELEKKAANLISEIIKEKFDNFHQITL